MQHRFAGKTAIITGGASGIGRATALRFLGEGGQAVVLDRHAADGERATSLRNEADAGKRLLYHTVELSDEAAVEAAVAKGAGVFGSADILLNIAGYGAPPKPIETIKRSEWDELLGANLTSAFLVTRAALPAMRKQGAGRIVNMSSVAGRGVSPGTMIPYAVSKAALMGFTRKLAYEEAKHGITVNAVAPGTVLTERVLARFENSAAQANTLSAIPMGRAARPEEIAAVILFLASEDASYVTGAVWDVNGGKLMA